MPFEAHMETATGKRSNVVLPLTLSGNLSTGNFGREASKQNHNSAHTYATKKEIVIRSIPSYCIKVKNKPDIQRS